MTGLAGARHTQLIPVLTADEVALACRSTAGPPVQFGTGEAVFAASEWHAPAFVVTEGCVEVSAAMTPGTRRSSCGTEPGRLTTKSISSQAGPCSTTGVGEAVCNALASAAHLRAPVVANADIGEIVMRAFILRRTVLIGSPRLAELSRLQGFLTRNGYPVTILNSVTDPEAAAIVAWFDLAPDELPIALCLNGMLLRRPLDVELALSLGITPELQPDRMFDVAFMDAGPVEPVTAPDMVVRCQ